MAPRAKRGPPSAASSSTDREPPPKRTHRKRDVPHQKDVDVVEAVGVQQLRRRKRRRPEVNDNSSTASTSTRPPVPPPVPRIPTTSVPNHKRNSKPISLTPQPEYLDLEGTDMEGRHYNDLMIEKIRSYRTISFPAKPGSRLPFLIRNLAHERFQTYRVHDPISFGTDEPPRLPYTEKLRVRYNREEQMRHFELIVDALRNRSERQDEVETNEGFGHDYSFSVGTLAMYVEFGREALFDNDKFFRFCQLKLEKAESEIERLSELSLVTEARDCRKTRDQRRILAVVQKGDPVSVDMDENENTVSPVSASIEEKSTDSTMPDDTTISMDGVSPALPSSSRDSPSLLKDSDSEASDIPCPTLRFHTLTHQSLGSNRLAIITCHLVPQYGQKYGTPQPLATKFFMKLNESMGQAIPIRIDLVEYDGDMKGLSMIHLLVEVHFSTEQSDGRAARSLRRRENEKDMKDMDGVPPPGPSDFHKRDIQPDPTVPHMFGACELTDETLEDERHLYDYKSIILVSSARLLQPDIPWKREIDDFMKRIPFVASREHTNPFLKIHFVEETLNQRRDERKKEEDLRRKRVEEDERIRREEEEKKVKKIREKEERLRRKQEKREKKINRQYVTREGNRICTFFEAFAGVKGDPVTALEQEQLYTEHVTRITQLFGKSFEEIKKSPGLLRSAERVLGLDFPEKIFYRIAGHVPRNARSLHKSFVDITTGGSSSTVTSPSRATLSDGVGNKDADLVLSSGDEGFDNDKYADDTDSGSEAGPSQANDDRNDAESEDPLLRYSTTIRKAPIDLKKYTPVLVIDEMYEESLKAREEEEDRLNRESRISTPPPLDLFHEEGKKLTATPVNSDAVNEETSQRKLTRASLRKHRDSLTTTDPSPKRSRKKLDRRSSDDEDCPPKLSPQLCDGASKSFTGMPELMEEDIKEEKSHVSEHQEVFHDTEFHESVCERSTKMTRRERIAKLLRQWKARRSERRANWICARRQRRRISHPLYTCTIAGKRRKYLQSSVADVEMQRLPYALRSVRARRRPRRLMQLSLSSLKSFAMVYAFYVYGKWSRDDVVNWISLADNKIRKDYGIWKKKSMLAKTTGFTLTKEQQEKVNKIERSFALWKTLCINLCNLLKGAQYEYIFEEDQEVATLREVCLRLQKSKGVHLEAVLQKKSSHASLTTTVTPSSTLSHIVSSELDFPTPEQEKQFFKAVNDGSALQNSSFYRSLYTPVCRLNLYLVPTDKRKMVIEAQKTGDEDWLIFVVWVENSKKSLPSCTPTKETNGLFKPVDKFQHHLVDFIAKIVKATIKEDKENYRVHFFNSRHHETVLMVVDAIDTTMDITEPTVDTSLLDKTRKTGCYKKRIKKKKQARRISQTSISSHVLSQETETEPMDTTSHANLPAAQDVPQPRRRGRPKKIQLTEEQKNKLDQEDEKVEPRRTRSHGLADTPEKPTEEGVQTRSKRNSIVSPTVKTVPEQLSSPSSYVLTRKRSLRSNEEKLGVEKEKDASSPPLTKCHSDKQDKNEMPAASGSRKMSIQAQRNKEKLQAEWMDCVLNGNKIGQDGRSEDKKRQRGSDCRRRVEEKRNDVESSSDTNSEDNRSRRRYSQRIVKFKAAKKKKRAKSLKDRIQEEANESLLGRALATILPWCEGSEFKYDRREFLQSESTEEGEEPKHIETKDAATCTATTQPARYNFDDKHVSRRVMSQQRSRPGRLDKLQYSPRFLVPPSRRRRSARLAELAHGGSLPPSQLPSWSPQREVRSKRFAHLQPLRAHAYESTTDNESEDEKFEKNKAGLSPNFKKNLEVISEIFDRDAKLRRRRDEQSSVDGSLKEMENAISQNNFTLEHPDALSTSKNNFEYADDFQQLHELEWHRAANGRKSSSYESTTSSRRLSWPSHGRDDMRRVAEKALVKRPASRQCEKNDIMHNEIPEVVEEELCTNSREIVQLDGNDSDVSVARGPNERLCHNVQLVSDDDEPIPTMVLTICLAEYDRSWEMCHANDLHQLDGNGDDMNSPPTGNSQNEKMDQPRSLSTSPDRRITDSLFHKRLARNRTRSLRYGDMILRKRRPHKLESVSTAKAESKEAIVNDNAIACAPSLSRHSLDQHRLLLTRGDLPGLTRKRSWDHRAGMLCALPGEPSACSSSSRGATISIVSPSIARPTGFANTVRINEREEPSSLYVNLNVKRPSRPHPPPPCQGEHGCWNGFEDMADHIRGTCTCDGPDNRVPTGVMREKPRKWPYVNEKEERMPATNGSSQVFGPEQRCSFEAQAGCSKAYDSQQAPSGNSSDSDRLPVSSIPGDVITDEERAMLLAIPDIDIPPSAAPKIAKLKPHLRDSDDTLSRAALLAIPDIDVPPSPVKSTFSSSVTVVQGNRSQRVRPVATVAPQVRRTEGAEHTQPIHQEPTRNMMDASINEKPTDAGVECESNELGLPKGMTLDDFMDTPCHFSSTLTSKISKRIARVLPVKVPKKNFRQRRALLAEKAKRTAEEERHTLYKTELPEDQDEQNEEQTIEVGSIMSHGSEQDEGKARKRRTKFDVAMENSRSKTTYIVPDKYGNWKRITAEQYATLTEKIDEKIARKLGVHPRDLRKQEEEKERNKIIVHKQKIFVDDHSDQESQESSQITPSGRCKQGRNAAREIIGTLKVKYTEIEANQPDRCFICDRRFKNMFSLLMHYTLTYPGLNIRIVPTICDEGRNSTMPNAMIIDVQLDLSADTSFEIGTLRSRLITGRRTLTLHSQRYAHRPPIFITNHIESYHLTRLMRMDMTLFLEKMHTPERLRQLDLYKIEWSSQYSEINKRDMYQYGPSGLKFNVFDMWSFIKISDVLDFVDIDSDEMSLILMVAYFHDSLTRDQQMASCYMKWKYFLSLYYPLVHKLRLTEFLWCLLHCQRMARLLKKHEYTDLLLRMCNYSDKKEEIDYDPLRHPINSAYVYLFMKAEKQYNLLQKRVQRRPSKYGKPFLETDIPEALRVDPTTLSIDDLQEVFGFVMNTYIKKMKMKQLYIDEVDYFLGRTCSIYDAPPFLFPPPSLILVKDNSLCLQALDDSNGTKVFPGKYFRGIAEQRGLVEEIFDEDQES